MAELLIFEMMGNIMRTPNRMLWLLSLIASTNVTGQGSPPRITSFKIAGGSFNTADRSVGLDIQVEGAAPIAYRVSERADLSGAVWKAYDTSPTFSLSSTLGAKILFIQVGSSRDLSSATPRTTVTAPVRTIGNFVPTPPIISAIASDTIILGLPDLTATVEMPAQVKDGDHRTFEFTVVVTNKGQGTPPGQVIELYNSFVLNQLAIENFDVTFGAAKLVGKRCRITDVPTLECSLAPMPPGGGVQVKITGSVTRLLRPGQTESSPTLRTRISGIAESNTANNWVDTPLKVVK
jgi:hypothetical protein